MTNPDSVEAQTQSDTQKSRRYFWILWVILALLAFILMGTIGATSGYRVAQANWSATQSALFVKSLVEQYELGVQELSSGHYDLARQRFEYILAREPAYPGAADKLAEALAVLYATATPSPVPPTETATRTQTSTPTEDLRPIDDKFNNLQAAYARGDWDAAINTILSLRQVDQIYRVAEVDGMLYRALRNRGIKKITEESDLEGGIYDLTLAERIGPIDSEALTYRDLARYYMMGSSFWEVYPKQAVYYFGIVASASPYLRDASGWTAAARYREALIQYADQLARDEDWCNAQIQYELAISYGGNLHIRSTAEFVAHQCSPPTETPSPITETPTPTITSSPTIDGFITPTPTWTQVLPPTIIPSLTSTGEPIIIPTQTGIPTLGWTPTTIPSIPPTPSITVGPTPSLTPTNTPVLLPTETPTAGNQPTEQSTPTPSPTIEGTSGDTAN